MGMPEQSYRPIGFCEDNQELLLRIINAADTRLDSDDPRLMTATLSDNGQFIIDRGLVTPGHIRTQYITQGKDLPDDSCLALEAIEENESYTNGAASMLHYLCGSLAMGVASSIGERPAPGQKPSELAMALVSPQKAVWNGFLAGAIELNKDFLSIDKVALTNAVLYGSANYYAIITNDGPIQYSLISTMIDGSVMTAETEANTLDVEIDLLCLTFFNARIDMATTILAGTYDDETLETMLEELAETANPPADLEQFISISDAIEQLRAYGKAVKDSQRLQRELGLSGPSTGVLEAIEKALY